MSNIVDRCIAAADAARLDFVDWEPDCKDELVEAVISEIGRWIKEKERNAPPSEMASIPVAWRLLRLEMESERKKL
jgi:hypothetical protein